MARVIYEKRSREKKPRKEAFACVMEFLYLISAIPLPFARHAKDKNPRGEGISLRNSRRYYRPDEQPNGPRERRNLLAAYVEVHKHCRCLRAVLRGEKQKTRAISTAPLNSNRSFPSLRLTPI
jgi:hypothetical protein